MITLLVALDICAVVCVLLLLRRLLFSPKQVPLPPGPRGLPLVGAVFDMPSEREWMTFSQWADRWGEICSATVLGQPIVIIGSSKIAVDILDKRSAIYSDRPVCTMGWKNTLVLLQYGDRFRRFRRLFHNIIGSRAAIKQFLPIDEEETRRFLRRVLAKPGDLNKHIRKTAGAVILRISHGYEVKETNDPFVQLAEQATEQFSLSTAPGGFMVDLIPALRHVPAWFPFAGWRRKANAWAATLNQLVEQPYNFVKAAGIAPVSFTSTLLEPKHITPEEEFDIKWSSASLYSVSAVSAFFLANDAQPRVVGGDRLPTFADRDDLPCKTRAGVPHRAMRDDGTLVLTNIHRITHDARTYADPMAIFISCAMALAVFDISKCVENGKVVNPVHENTTGTIRYLIPFNLAGH
ncbi:cytochrome P450 [Mycena filopes]|nr:cytochrome P450 [Mycena filopes]